jgi:hypothetical protein
MIGGNRGQYRAWTKAKIAATNMQAARASHSAYSPVTTAVITKTAADDPTSPATKAGGRRGPLLSDESMPRVSRGIPAGASDRFVIREPALLNHNRNVRS